MAAPIKWNTAPRFDAMAFIRNSSRDLDRSFSKITDQLTARQDRVGEENTARMIEQIQGLSNQGEYDQAVQSGQFNVDALNKLGGNIDLGKIQSSFAGRDNAIRQEVFDRDRLGQIQKAREFDPIFNSITSQIGQTGSNEEVNALISGSEGKLPAGYMSKLVEAGSAQKRAIQAKFFQNHRRAGIVGDDKYDPLVDARMGDAGQLKTVEQLDASLVGAKEELDPERYTQFVNYINQRKGDIGQQTRSSVLASKLAKDAINKPILAGLLSKMARATTKEELEQIRAEGLDSGLDPINMKTFDYEANTHGKRVAELVQEGREERDFQQDKYAKELIPTTLNTAFDRSTRLTDRRNELFGDPDDWDPQARFEIDSEGKVAIRDQGDLTDQEVLREEVTARDSIAQIYDSAPAFREVATNYRKDLVARGLDTNEIDSKVKVLKQQFDKRQAPTRSVREQAVVDKKANAVKAASKKVLDDVQIEFDKFEKTHKELTTTTNPEEIATGYNAITDKATKDFPGASWWRKHYGADELRTEITELRNNGIDVTLDNGSVVNKKIPPSVMKDALGFSNESDGWIFNEGINMDKLRSELKLRILERIGYGSQWKENRDAIKSKLDATKLAHKTGVVAIDEQANKPSFGLTAEEMFNSLDKLGK